LTAYGPVVAETVDRFDGIEDLEHFAKQIRNGMLNNAKNEAPGLEEDQGRIQDLETDSARFKTEWHTLRSRGIVCITKEQYSASLQKSGCQSFHFPGLATSWSSNENYKPSCLLDCFRFRCLKPSMAEDLEGLDWQIRKEKDSKHYAPTIHEIHKKVWTTTSCGNRLPFWK
jgi:hypothetical protein